MTWNPMQCTEERNRSLQSGNHAGGEEGKVRERELDQGSQDKL